MNQSPVLASIGDKSTREEQALQFTVSATDPNGDPLTYASANLPAGASFDPASQTFSWTPALGQAGTYPNVQFSVTDNGSLSDSENITITVTANSAPVLASIGDKTAHVDMTLQFTISATDPDSDPLTYAAANLPAGASFDPASQTFSWTPATGQAGTYPNVQFSVTDSGSLSDSENITITVTANSAPVLTNPGDKTSDEGTVLAFTLAATDPDNDTLSFSSPNLPAGASLDPSTGAFTWTPGYDQAGTYSNVQFIVSDSQLTDSESITITVNNVNRAPVLSAIGDKSVTEGQSLSFTILATDPDGDSLSYSASNLPSGSSFDSTSREFTWTPASAQVGSYTNVRFEVTDSTASDSEDITITVNASTPPPSPPVGGGGGGSGTSGGGGGAAGITSLRASMNAQGQTFEAVSATDINLKVELRIYQGTVVTNVNGQAATSIRITPLGESNPPDSGSQLISQSFEIEQSGTTFSPSATLIFRYSNSDIPQDVSEDNLYIALWDPVALEWIDLGGTVNPDANTVSVPIEHLSTYALMAHTRPASFTLTNFTLTPGEVNPGDTVQASVDVNNQGDLDGTYEAELVMDDTTVQTRTVTLAGGHSQTVAFTIAPDTAGEYQIGIGNSLAMLVVKTPLSPAAFTVSQLNISPLTTAAGENVNVTASIKNNGDLAGVYQAVLTVDDVAVQTKEVTLDGGGSATVSFSLTPDVIGQHKLGIGDLLAPFEVKSPAAPVTAERPASSAPAAAGASAPKLDSFSVTPIYDGATNKIVSVNVKFQMDQTYDSFPDARLMMTVFCNDSFLEQVPLFTLGQLQEDGKTGELSYVPFRGWEPGQYTFRAELYQGDNLVQDMLSPQGITPEAATRTVSLWLLGAVIGGAVFVIAIVIACVLYRRRDMLRS